MAAAAAGANPFGSRPDPAIERFNALDRLLISPLLPRISMARFAQCPHGWAVAV